MAFICLGVVGGRDSAHATESTVSNNSNNTVKASNASDKSPSTNSRNKKFQFGAEIVGRARADWYKASVKKDFGENFLNLNKKTLTNNLTQTDITNVVNAIINNFPGLQNTINNLTNEQRNTVLKKIFEVQSITITYSDNFTGDALNATTTRITDICNTLGINLQQLGVAL